MTLKLNMDVVTNNCSNSNFDDDLQSTDSCSDHSSLNDIFRPKKSYYKRKKPLNKKSKSKKSKKSPFNHSLWNIKENMLYRLFLLEKGHLFNSNSIERREMKINVQMFQHIKVRSADQCRSHHQKMMKHFGSVLNIVQHIEKLMEQEGLTIDRKMIESNENNELVHDPLQDWNELQMNNKKQESLWEKLMRETLSLHQQKRILPLEVHL